MTCLSLGPTGVAAIPVVGFASRIGARAGRTRRRSGGSRAACALPDLGVQRRPAEPHAHHGDAAPLHVVVRGAHGRSRRGRCRLAPPPTGTETLKPDGPGSGVPLVGKSLMRPGTTLPVGAWRACRDRSTPSAGARRRVRSRESRRRALRHERGCDPEQQIHLDGVDEALQARAAHHSLQIVRGTARATDDNSTPRHSGRTQTKPGPPRARLRRSPLGGPTS